MTRLKKHPLPWKGRWISLPQTGNEQKVMELMKYDCFIKLRKLQYDDALKQATRFLEKAYGSKNRGLQIEAEWAMGHVQHQIDQPAQALIHLAKCEDLATQSLKIWMHLSIPLLPNPR